MLTPDHFRNLRAGPILEAGRMNGATVRGWVAEMKLVLGDRSTREAGNPRYDLADCARVFMLYILTKKIGMDARPAIWVVNKAYGYIAEIAEAELQAIGTGAAPDCPRYELMLPAMSLDVETNPEIRLYNDDASIAERESNRGMWCKITMDLREIVRHARNELSCVLGHSLSGLRHDFADAQEN